MPVRAKFGHFPFPSLAIICLFAIVLAACTALLAPQVSTPASTLPAAEIPTQPPRVTPSPPRETWLASSPAPAPYLTPSEAKPPPALTPESTLAATTEGIRFAVIGDYGSGNKNAEAVANLVKSWDPDFIITTGDNNYPSGAASTIDHNIGQFYHEYIHPYKGSYGEGASFNRFFPTLGNHDWDTASAQPYLDYFTLPGNERYYDFTWGPVHFFALDGDYREPDGVGRTSKQALWLRDQLAASASPWKIVYVHHPPYSSGLHGSIEWMRWPFQEWGASILLAGHDHLYERLLIDGFPYITNGLGGGAIYSFKDALPGSQVRFTGKHGAMLVEASEENLIFQFITIEGEVVDFYMLAPPASLYVPLVQRTHLISTSLALRRLIP